MPQTHAVTAGDVGHAELLFPTTKRCIYRMRVVPAVTAAYSGRISDFRAGSAQRSCFSSGLLSSTIKPDTFCEKPDLLNASRVGKTVQRRFTSLTSRGHVSEFPKLLIVQRALTSLLVFVLSFAAYPQSVDAQDQPGGQPDQCPGGRPDDRPDRRAPDGPGGGAWHAPGGAAGACAATLESTT